VAIGDDDFKLCMGSWVSGVTILTTRSGEQIHGMTVSDFSGASLSPPLVTVCCSKDSVTTGLIAEGKCFAVNVLAADQQELSNRFASKKYEDVRFEGLDYSTAKTGAPLIRGALARMDCKLEATHDAGDHVIYVGQIVAAEVEEREPLVYWNGAYRQLVPVD
jgi:flavin reductase (DIM6/NTAB) family NADH-FMN oxidoreductase RutF